MNYVSAGERPLSHLLPLLGDGEQGVRAARNGPHHLVQEQRQVLPNWHHVRLEVRRGVRQVKRAGALPGEF